MIPFRGMEGCMKNIHRIFCKVEAKTGRWDLSIRMTAGRISHSTRQGRAFQPHSEGLSCYRFLLPWEKPPFHPGAWLPQPSPIWAPRSCHLRAWLAGARWLPRRSNAVGARDTAEGGGKTKMRGKKEEEDVLPCSFKADSRLPREGREGKGCAQAAARAAGRAGRAAPLPGRGRQQGG